MSLAKLKAKETKGKQKSLPKLKTILANPYTSKCPALSDDELQELRELFKSVLPKSKEARAFANKINVRLGLESCLRSIKNSEMSCVLLSRNIKPHFIVNLIARNVAVKDKTVPVYMHPNLENFIEELFGVRALAMVFPLKLDLLGKNLENWVKAHRNHSENKAVQLSKRIDSGNLYKKRNEVQKEIVCLGKEDIIQKTPIAKLQENKEWTGDFISFANSDYNKELSKIKLDEDEHNLQNVLSALSNKVTTEKKAKDDSPTSTKLIQQIDEDNNAVYENRHSSDSDDFLSEYKPLTVYKIRPNPDKKPKKKRKKNKKK